VSTLTFKTLYVLVFIAHGRRELVHAKVTTKPTAAWVWHQLIEATPWRRPRHLLRDRDAIYGRDFRQRVKRIGIDAIATPVRSQRANAIAERVIGTLSREYLDPHDHARRAAPSGSRLRGRSRRADAPPQSPRAREPGSRGSAVTCA
jgi:transposase InsO family protein